MHAGPSQPVSARLDPPAGSPIVVRLQADHVLAGTQSVGRTRHGLEGDGASPPVHLAQRVARVDHEIPERLVDPYDGAAGPTRAVDRRPRPAVGVTHEVGVGRVEHSGTHESRSPKSRSVPSTGVTAPPGEPAVVEVEGPMRRDVQDRPVDCLGAYRQVGMKAQAEGDGALFERPGHRGDGQPVPTDVILEFEEQRERVSRRGMELQSEGQLVLVAGLECPGEPAHQAVDGVATLGLVEGGLGPHPVVLVAAVAQPVGPRGEHLAAARVRPLVGTEAVEDAALAHGVRAQRGTDLTDDHLLATVPDAPLLARGRGDRDPGGAWWHRA